MKIKFSALIIFLFLLVSSNRALAQYSTPEGYGGSNKKKEESRQNIKSFPYKRFMMEGGGTFHFPDFPGGVSFFYGAGFSPQYLLSAWSEDGSFALSSQTALGLFFISDISTNRSQMIFNLSVPLWAELRLGAGATSEQVSNRGKFICWC